MSDEQCGADPFENGYDQKLSEKEYRERIKYLMRCHDDSADEIERLRAENERLRGALRFYADPWKYTDIYGDDVRVPDFYSELDFAETARAALGEEKK